MARLTIDPVTRVGGQLRIEVEVANGAVTDAWSSGTVFRGIERILDGRDGRDAWLLAQRVCGGCSGVHALASVRAVERALGVMPPKNARLIRDIIAGGQLVLDHVVGYYHRHALDWLDVGAALGADTAAAAAFAASISDRTPPTATSLKAVRDRIAAYIDTGGGALFDRAYAGHPAYRLRPEAGLVVLAHYLEALDWQRRMVRLQTLLGGKSPHPQSFLVGGMALAPMWGGPAAGGREHPQQPDEDSPTALSERGLAEVGQILAAAKDFVEQVYLPDVLAVASAYPEWTSIGKGIGEYLSYGEFPEDDTDHPALHLPRGRIVRGDFAQVADVYEQGVAEGVAHAWYEDDGSRTLVRPTDSPPEPRYAGPKPPFESLANADRYSWVKAPRFEGAPMEVGPLARVLVANVEGRRDVQAGLQAALSKLGLGAAALSGTLGRTVARAVEAQVIAARLVGWHVELVANLAKGDLAVADVSHWDPASWPSQAEGWSLGESSRGAVGHWVRLRDGRIERYAIVDATTWNASPRDAKGWRGAIEEALIGTPVADTSRPLEVLRTVRSFDPCLACAVHQLDPRGRAAISIDPREVRR